MSRFNKLLKEYKVNVLNEEEVPDPAQDAGGAPVQDPAAGGMEQDPAAEQEDPQENMNKLLKAAKKPFPHLAGILSRAIKYNWTDDQLQELDNYLSGGLTMDDFISIITDVDGDNGMSSNIQDEFSPDIIGAAVSLFDAVENIMKADDKDGEDYVVAPAEDI